NELECAEDGSVYANVWTTDTVVRIDPSDGAVTNVYDASALREELVTDGSTSTVDVLNGIAQIPGTDRFLLTGKYWPQMFEVRFVN
ncbi:glutaminyl-peptide cyclotransferase, partial [Rhodococcus erythropolis]|nr:glutaminyl-peptide cyclotransferase [Rhodococcus erythropolis]